MFGELAHGPDVGLLGAFGHPLQLQVINETLSECCHSDTSMLTDIHLDSEHNMVL